MQLGKTLRENADYYGDFNKESSKDMSEIASKFIREAKKVLKK